MKIKMIIATNHRKDFAKILADRIGTTSEYLGTPSMAYRTGAFTFNKDCTVTVEEGKDATPLTEILDEQGIIYEVEEEQTDLNIEMPREFFTEEALENLQKILDSKATLLKKVTGTENLPINISDEKVSFPWFKTGNAEEAKAYANLISKMSIMANEAKRVTAKEKDVESDKYAFRCFLIRLGFKGNEYKDDRKLLLKNLEGPAAFPTQAAADEFFAKQKAKREVTA